MKDFSREIHDLLGTTVLDEPEVSGFHTSLFGSLLSPPKWKGAFGYAWYQFTSLAIPA